MAQPRYLAHLATNVFIVPDGLAQFGMLVGGSHEDGQHDAHVLAWCRQIREGLR